MIGRLSGKVAVEEGDGSVVLDVGGVGYEVFVPLGTLGRATTDDGGRVVLYVHTHVREDALILYGFASDTEKATFRTLLGVDRLGPKSALAILGTLRPADLSRAVAMRDKKAFTAVPGIGPKLAETILFKLKDKALPEEPRGAGAPAVAAAAPASQGALLATALVGLGYRQADADRAVSHLGDRASHEPFPQLLKEALALLAR